MKSKCMICGCEFEQKLKFKTNSCKKCRKEWDIPYFSLKNGYASCNGKYYHQYVASLFLGRKLKVNEVVHHWNENKRDNDPENLCVFPSQREHLAFHKESIRLKNELIKKYKGIRVPLLKQ